MPFLSCAPEYCVMKIPPARQMVFENTMNMKIICPVMFTPDIFISPSPETMKLSISDTMLCMSCCSMIGTAIASAPA